MAPPTAAPADTSVPTSPLPQQGVEPDPGSCQDSPAHGVPVGGELNYLDDGTLALAMKARTPVG